MRLAHNSHHRSISREFFNSERVCAACARALKRAKSGALLAFAEARGGHSGSSSDNGDVQVVMRASADGSGKNGTWGKIHKVAFEAKHTIGECSMQLPATRSPASSDPPATHCVALQATLPPSWTSARARSSATSPRTTQTPL